MQLALPEIDAADGIAFDERIRQLAARSQPESIHQFGERAAGLPILVSNHQGRSHQPAHQFLEHPPQSVLAGRQQSRMVLKELPQPAFDPVFLRHTPLPDLVPVPEREAPVQLQPAVTGLIDLPRDNPRLVQFSLSQIDRPVLNRQPVLTPLCAVLIGQLPVTDPLVDAVRVVAFLRIESRIPLQSHASRMQVRPEAPAVDSIGRHVNDGNGRSLSLTCRSHFRGCHLHLLPLAFFHLPLQFPQHEPLTVQEHLPAFTLRHWRFAGQQVGSRQPHPDPIADVRIRQQIEPVNLAGFTPEHIADSQQRVVSPGLVDLFPWLPKLTMVRTAGPRSP